MKNGVLVYKAYNNRFNIGDYIQSLAALQFLHKPVEYINRESLDEYQGEPVRLIMNGWFMHEPEHWPPSNKINPLFVSFHLNSDAYELLNNNSAVNYFKKHQPIGCRDKKTRDLLVEKGVDAYFSGCLTLTLGEKYKTKGQRNNKTYFVDPYYEFKRDIKHIFYYSLSLISHFATIRTIVKKKHGKFTLKNALRTTAFYLQYNQLFESNVLKNANYITHMVNDYDFENEDKRFDYAEELLKEYSQAKMVVTSRIHCALPCLSMETPVLYTDRYSHDETSSCRLDGLKELFNTIKVYTNKLECELLMTEKKINSDFSFNNKTEYLLLKEKLIKLMAAV